MVKQLIHLLKYCTVSFVVVELYLSVAILGDFLLHYFNQMAGWLQIHSLHS